MIRGRVDRLRRRRRSTVAPTAATWSTSEAPAPASRLTSPMCTPELAYPPGAVAAPVSVAVTRRARLSISHHLPGDRRSEGTPYSVQLSAGDGVAASGRLRVTRPLYPHRSVHTGGLTRHTSDRPASVFCGCPTRIGHRQ